MARYKIKKEFFPYSLFDSLSGFPYNENAIAKVYDLEEFYEPYRKNPHSP